MCFHKSRDYNDKRPKIVSVTTNENGVFRHMVYTYDEDGGKCGVGYIIPDDLVIWSGSNEEGTIENMLLMFPEYFI